MAKGNFRVMVIPLAVIGLAIGAMPIRADDTGLAASMHDVRKEGGRLCLATHAHAGSGEGPTKSAAVTAAIRSWWEYTAWEYGSDWAKWNKAASKRVDYTKATNGWSATVESRPCK